MTSVNFDIINTIGITITKYTGKTVAFAGDIRVFREFYINDSIVTHVMVVIISAIYHGLWEK